MTQRPGEIYIDAPISEDSDVVNVPTVWLDFHELDKQDFKDKMTRYIPFQLKWLMSHWEQDFNLSDCIDAFFEEEKRREETEKNQTVSLQKEQL